MAGVPLSSLIRLSGGFLLCRSFMPAGRGTQGGIVFPQGENAFYVKGRFSINFLFRRPRAALYDQEDL